MAPLSSQHDVFIAVCYGIETDSRAYYDMHSGTANTVFVGSADAAGPGLPDGAGHPARLSFVNTYGSGTFALAVADDVDGRGVGELRYQVTLTIPEPSTWALFGLGAWAAEGVEAKRAKTGAAWCYREAHSCSYGRTREYRDAPVSRALQPTRFCRPRS